MNGGIGWQHSASRTRKLFFRDHVLLPFLTMQIALRRRLRLPLPLAPGRCGNASETGCGRRADAFDETTHPHVRGKAS